jgi:Fe2+ or Zn2+ uptake regulation protein
LLESWEDDKINLYTEIQDFELTTIYKVLNLFNEQTETASIESE